MRCWTNSPRGGSDAVDGQRAGAGRERGRALGRGPGRAAHPGAPRGGGRGQRDGGAPLDLGDQPGGGRRRGRGAHRGAGRLTMLFGEGDSRLTLGTGAANSLAALEEAITASGAELV